MLRSDLQVAIDAALSVLPNSDSRRDFINNATTVLLKSVVIAAVDIEDRSTSSQFPINITDAETRRTLDSFVEDIDKRSEKILNHREWSDDPIPGELLSPCHMAECLKEQAPQVYECIVAWVVPEFRSEASSSSSYVSSSISSLLSARDHFVAE